MKIISISIFSSSDMHQSHHLLGCHVIGINSLLIFFFNSSRIFFHVLMFFAFFKFNMPSRKSDMNNCIRIIFIKTIIKINIIKIYIKNTHFITTKYNITRIFIKIECIVICKQSNKKFLIILLVAKQSGISFNAARESSTTSSSIFWVIYLSGQYTSKKDLQKQLYHTFLEFYINKE